MGTKLCSRCAVKKAWVDGLCGACYHEVNGAPYKPKVSRKATGGGSVETETNKPKTGTKRIKSETSERKKDVISTTLRRPVKQAPDESPPLGFVPLEIEYEGERNNSGHPQRLRMRAAILPGQNPAMVYAVVAAWVEEQIDGEVNYLESRKKSLTGDVAALDQKRRELVEEVHNLATTIATARKIAGAAEAHT